MLISSFKLHVWKYTIDLTTCVMVIQVQSAASQIVQTKIPFALSTFYNLYAVQHWVSYDSMNDTIVIVPN